MSPKYTGFLSVFVFMLSFAVLTSPSAYHQHSVPDMDHRILLSLRPRYQPTESGLNGASGGSQARKFGDFLRRTKPIRPAGCLTD
jgi:hypothetical protein